MRLAHKPTRLSPYRAIILIIISIVLAIALAELYQFVAQCSGWPTWIAAATVHTALAVIVVGITLKRGQGATFGLRAPAQSANAPFRRRPSLMFLPALAVLGGATLLVAVTRAFGEPTTSVPTPWAWIFWIPVIEELVFRLGLGAYLREVAPGFWSSWCGALVFAAVHTEPTLARVLAGQVGLPLGPFLLGLACEMLLVSTGRIAPAIALHAACNMTVTVFALGDARWLDWLGILYG